MFTHYRTQGIFLKKEDRGEADQLFTVFTEDFGKLEVLGRAIRKIKSKLRSGSDIFYFSEIEFIQGKNYKTLTDAILIDRFKNLRQAPERLEIIYRVADDLDCLTGSGERDEAIWNLLNETFKRVENCRTENSLTIEMTTENCKLKIIYLFFLWRLFSLLGYAPELYSCPVCGKKLLPETFFFVPQEGGVVCWRCFKNTENKEMAKELSVDAAKIIRIFTKEDWQKTNRLKMGEEIKENLKETSELYLNYLKEQFSTNP